MADLEAARTAFLTSLVGKSAHTVRTYRVALKRFAASTSVRRAEKLRVEHVEQFAQALKGEHLDPSTIDNYLCAANRFYRYLVRKRVLKLDTAELEELSTVVHEARARKTRLPRVPEKSVIEAITAAAERAVARTGEAHTRQPSHADRRRQWLRALRNLALVLCLQTSGMRLGEAITLKRGDLINSKHGARVIGKENKERTVFFSPRAWAALQNYMRARGDGAEGTALAEHPLFCSHARQRSGKALTHQRVEQEVYDLCERAGVARIVPHQTRHYFADALLKKSERLDVVQAALGHSKPETTQRYARAGEADVAQNVNALYALEEQQK